ncbi:right-handed parallel beta-helix repeat-containing protein [bacterium]|nr:right-handed parallel beta-helix repeat-containing protein [bacterium]
MSSNCRFRKSWLRTAGIVALILLLEVSVMAAYQPALITPEADGETFLPFPHFTWSEHPQGFQHVAQPVRYEIQIASDEEFVNVVDQDKVYLNRYIHDRPLATGEYYWRVRALPWATDPTDWSTTGHFTVTPCDEQVQVSYSAGAWDHLSAVQAALAQAKTLAATGKSVRVNFPKGTYRFDSPGASLLTLTGTKNIVIDGNGSTIHALRYNSGLAYLNTAENVAIMGFEFDCPNEKTFLQARVLATDDAGGTITVQLEPGYPGYDTPYVQQGAATSFVSLLDPAIDGRLKDDGYNAYFFTAYDSRPDDTWMMTLQRPELTKYFDAGDRFVHFVRTSGFSLVQAFSCRNVTCYDIASYATSSLHYGAWEGTLFNVLHCEWKIAPGRWFSGNADGAHVRSLAIGPWIEGCNIQAIGDDGIALYARPASVSQLHPGGQTDTCLLNNEFMNLEPGDEVSFFDPPAGKILLECEVVSVEQQGSKWLTRFSQDVPTSVTTGGVLLEDTQIWNRSKSSGDFMIRNNTIRNIRRFGTVFRARRGVVEQNLYEAASASGVLFKNEPDYPNGLYCSDIIIRKNQFVECCFDRYHDAPITMHFRKRDNQNAPDMGPRRILIEANTFRGCPAPEVKLISTRDVVLRGNQVLDATPTRVPEVTEQNTENIQRLEWPGNSAAKNADLWE